MQTRRGVVTTPVVVHCTNGFAGLLVPELSRHIVPYRGQVHVIIPVPLLTGSNVLTRAHSLRYSLNHYYSIIQHLSDDTVILGCSLPNPALPREVIEGIRTIDDTNFNKEIQEDAMEHFNKMLPHAAVDKAVRGGCFVHALNGIVGLTTDEVPFLGSVDEKPGQFVCAGFNGHGTFLGACLALTSSNPSCQHTILQAWRGFSRAHPGWRN
jgi:glycine/D-amino acid oxidase-like deaminating enzyme